MVTLTRSSQENRSYLPPPTPLTWDEAPDWPWPGPPEFCRDDLALCTCSNGHTTRMSGRIHAVAPDGTVTPSYVCPIEGCGFHEFVRLVGWPP